jgi:hypothetical protein
MTIKLTTHATLPLKRRDYWQIVFFPTISLYRMGIKGNGHWAINAEFLFWSATLLIYNYDETRLYTLED